MNETSLECPWAHYQQGHFPICEEKVCGWIRQPANTYSNVAFFILGLYLIYLYYKKRSQHGLGLGLITVLIGAASFIAHASAIKFFGFFDFAAIYAMFAYFAAKNLIYTKYTKQQNTLIVFFWFFIPTILILFYFGEMRELIFACSVIGLLKWEAQILKKQNKDFLVSSMKKLLVTFTLAATCLALDASKLICEPNNHYFQFHACWHILNAISLYFLARHMDEHR